MEVKELAFAAESNCCTKACPNPENKLTEQKSPFQSLFKSALEQADAGGDSGEDLKSDIAKKGWNAAFIPNVMFSFNGQGFGETVNLTPVVDASLTSGLKMELGTGSKVLTAGEDVPDGARLTGVQDSRMLCKTGMGNGEASNVKADNAEVNGKPAVEEHLDQKPVLRPEGSITANNAFEELAGDVDSGNEKGQMPENPEVNQLEELLSKNTAGKEKAEKQELQRPADNAEDDRKSIGREEAKVRVDTQLKTGNKPLDFELRVEQSKNGKNDMTTVEKPDIVHQTMDRIKLMVNSKKSEISVQLKPENLGRLSFKLEVVNGVLNGKITVQSSQVREVVQANLNQLKENLEQIGIPVSRLTVNIGGNGDYRQHQFNQESQHGYTGRWMTGTYQENEAVEAYRWIGEGTVEYLV